MKDSNKERERTLRTDEEWALALAMSDTREAVDDAAAARDKLLMALAGLETDIENGNDLQDSVDRLRHALFNLCTHLVEARYFMNDALKDWEADLKDAAAR